MCMSLYLYTIGEMHHGGARHGDWAMLGAISETGNRPKDWAWWQQSGSFSNQQRAP